MSIIYVIDSFQKMSNFVLSFHKNGKKAELSTRKRNNKNLTDNSESKATNSVTKPILNTIKNNANPKRIRIIHKGENYEYYFLSAFKWIVCCIVVEGSL